MADAVVPGIGIGVVMEYEALRLRAEAADARGSEHEAQVLRLRANALLEAIGGELPAGEVEASLKALWRASPTSTLAECESGPAHSAGPIDGNLPSLSDYASCASLRRFAPLLAAPPPAPPQPPPPPPAKRPLHEPAVRAPVPPVPTFASAPSEPAPCGESRVQRLVDGFPGAWAQERRAGARGVRTE